ncbi:hypothetical protein GIB67_003756 [Kingdonia uniflora]|uniref:RRM domain-containing protein n=1 Tax=Kingdonia uniflora TaxID=39325 RepID=A0A7J7MSJ6_9MAGN|nr:hypothetical protein GIB67_003756 [Kingdonia uniflora]
MGVVVENGERPKLVFEVRLIFVQSFCVLDECDSYYRLCMFYFEDTEPNRVLLVTIHQLLYPITVDVLHQVFSSHGVVEKIVTFQKSAGFQALVQYQSCPSAVAARNALQGRNIYDGCCTLNIQYSNLNELQVNYNNERSRDFTNPDLPPEPKGRSSQLGYADTGNLYMQPLGARGVASPQMNNAAAIAAAFVGGLPPGISGTNERCTVLVSNLNTDKIDEDKIFNLFSIYGNIARIKILHNKPDHALVQMGDGFQAELAVHFLKVFCGLTVNDDLKELTLYLTSRAKNAMLLPILVIFFYPFFRRSITALFPTTFASSESHIFGLESRKAQAKVGTALETPTCFGVVGDGKPVGGLIGSARAVTGAPVVKVFNGGSTNRGGAVGVAMVGVMVVEGVLGEEDGLGLELNWLGLGLTSLAGLVGVWAWGSLFRVPNLLYLIAMVHSLACFGAPGKPIIVAVEFTALSSLGFESSKGALLFGKRLEVNFSKYPSITVAQDTHEYTNSNLNRFNRNASKNYRYCCSPTKMIHVSTLPADITEEEIITHLEEHGNIVNTKLFEANSKKQALVLFETEEQATEALVCKHATTMDGSVIRISFSQLQSI